MLLVDEGGIRWLFNFVLSCLMVYDVDAIVKGEPVGDGYGDTEWVISIDWIHESYEETLDCENKVFLSFLVKWVWDWVKNKVVDYVMSAISVVDMLKYFVVSVSSELSSNLLSSGDV